MPKLVVIIVVEGVDITPPGIIVRIKDCYEKQAHSRTSLSYSIE